MKALKVFDKVVCTAEEVIAAISLLAMCIVVFMAVVLRSIGIPFSISDELSRYLMIWCIYVGVAVATREKAHVGVDVLIQMLPEKVQKVLNIAVSFITLGVIVWLFYLTASWVWSTMQGNIQLTPLMKVPFYTVYISLPIGFGLSIIEQIKNMVKDIILVGKKDETKEEVSA
ncbi:MAG: TRAP transporter small permease [Hespellia sp.]|nr:TRAP transporter small permease [Hespellia sp.]